MSATSPLAVGAAALRAAGRRPPLPFSIELADGRTLTMRRLLRVLPGKRIVGEADFAGARVLAKLFVAAGSERHWQRERDGLAALHAAGIPTPAVCAETTLAGGGHALLTDFVADARSLADAWLQADGALPGEAAALALLAPALAMLARMHRAGLTQGDLHLGNFLQSGDELLVIDGDSVAAVAPAGRPLTAAEAAANLGMLLAQLPAAWDGVCAGPLAAYAAAGGIGGIDPVRLQAEIARVRDWRLQDFLGKCVRDCTLFAVDKRVTRFSAVVRAAAERLAPIVRDPDRALAAGERLKSGNTCTVARAGDLVVKRYNLKGVGHALSRVWRPSRAWHSWREAHRLGVYGIATPAPLALVEERFGPLRRRAWLLTDFCPGPNLAQHLAADSEPPAAEAAAIAVLFSTLHSLRISHGDLKATNLLWHEGRVWLIDLDACVQHKSEAAYRKAWKRDRARLLRNWPAASVLGRWLERTLPPA